MTVSIYREESRIANYRQRGRAFFSTVYPRLVGALIILKLAIPLMMITLFTFGLWSVTSGLMAEYHRVDAALKPKFDQVEKEIQNIRAEGRRLADEVARIKNQSTRAASEIKRAVEPIRRSLVAISNTVGAISRTFEKILNLIVGVINKIPFIGKLKPFNFPNINIPGFSLPKLDINLKLNFDVSALKALKEVCEQIAREAEASIATVRRIWTTWLWTFLIITILVPCWLLLCLVGMTARSWHKLKTAMQLIAGHTTSASLQML